MTVDWYSITISGNGLGDFFSGYISVDSSTNDILEIIDPGYLDINIIESINNLHASGGGNSLIFNKFNKNLLPNNPLSDGGIVLQTIPALDRIYHGREWNIWYTNGSFVISYKDSVTLEWVDVRDSSTSLVRFDVRFAYQAVPPQLNMLVTNICFPAGTPVKTDQGIVSIEKIDNNTNTIRNKKIIDVTKTLIKDKHLICFEKDSLGKNIPSQKTLITQNHKILYKGEMIKAQELINKNIYVHKVKYDGEPVYNVLMEEHSKMIVNNMICETLDPNNFIAKLHMHIRNKEPKEQQRIIKLFNEYVSENNVYSENKNK